MTDAKSIVYIVDDDPAVRKGLERLLRSAGLAVETFASAAEFLDHEGAHGVGCFVLDVRMPGEDGMALQPAASRRWTTHQGIANIQDWINGH